MSYSIEQQHQAVFDRIAKGTVNDDRQHVGHSVYAKQDTLVTVKNSNGYWHTPFCECDQIIVYVVRKKDVSALYAWLKSERPHFEVIEEERIVKFHHAPYKAVAPTAGAHTMVQIVGELHPIHTGR